MANKKAKKLGEVLAFSEVGVDTFKKGREGFKKVWDESYIDDLISINEEHVSSLKALINKLDESEAGINKSQATGEKLTSMRNMYIGDEWDDPIELFEWFGFFEGAAIVHWSLIEGFAEKGDDSEMKEVASKALDYHRELFEKVNKSIKSSVK